MIFSKVGIQLLLLVRKFTTQKIETENKQTKKRSPLKLPLIDSQLHNILTFVFFVGVEKHLKAYSYIWKHAKYIGEIKMSDSLLQKIKEQRFAFNSFTHLYKYRFPTNLASVQIKNYDFYLLEWYANLYRYCFLHLKLEESFKDDLKTLWKLQKI